MITHFLGKEEVAGYSQDLAERLCALGDDLPLVWCPVGRSGDKLLRVVSAALPPEVAAKIQIVELYFDKKARKICLGQGATEADLAGAKVLVLDSSVHSGKSMLAAMRLVTSAGAAKAIAYSLIVKRTSGFLPHFFGVVVNDHDRVLFQLDGIPNNRLFVQKYLPMGIFRRIEKTDVKRTEQTLDTGVKSIDKISLGDLYYEHRVNGFDVVLVEDGNAIAGFLKIKVTQRKGLLVDVIANDKNFRGKGLGGALMRYAETVGRASSCTHIELWAIDNMVDFYQKFGFESVGDEVDTGGGEAYQLMRRPLLYQFEMSDFE